MRFRMSNDYSTAADSPLAPAPGQGVRSNRAQTGASGIGKTNWWNLSFCNLTGALRAPLSPEIGAEVVWSVHNAW
ncbi:MAG: hypothetical protein ACOCXC_03030, partial [Fibrobacterota bacterium]